MPLERITEAILREARREAEKTVSEAQTRHDEGLEAARKSLDEEFEQRFERAREEAEQESQRKIMRRRGEHNLALLRRRNELLDELFDQAVERFAALPDEQYHAVMAAWMKEAPQDQPGEVLCALHDARRLAPVIEELNRSRAPGRQLKLTPGDRPVLGGVIFRTERFEIDMSLEARIARLREELAPEVAGIMFPPDITV